MCTRARVCFCLCLVVCLPVHVRVCALVCLSACACGCAGACGMYVYVHKCVAYYAQKCGIQSVASVQGIKPGEGSVAIIHYCCRLQGVQGPIVATSLTSILPGACVVTCIPSLQNTPPPTLISTPTRPSFKAASAETKRLGARLDQRSEKSGVQPPVLQLFSYGCSHGTVEHRWGVRGWRS